jgi:hypothetical protein
VHLRLCSTSPATAGGVSMEWIVTVVGILLVTVVARDMFHTLFHPVGHGSIASQVMKLVWRLLRLFPPDRRIASLTGPLGLAMWC